MTNKPFTRIVACAILAFTLSSCVTIGNQKLDDIGSYMQLKEHQSTKSDVYGIFGQPHDVRQIVPRDTVWVYYKYHSRPSAWTYVPFVGMAAGGAARETTFAYFTFDRSGVLQNVQTKSDTDYENQWAGIARGLARISDKSQAERVQDEMAAIGKPFDLEIAKQVAGVRDK